MLAFKQMDIYKYNHKCRSIHHSGTLMRTHNWTKSSQPSGNPWKVVPQNLPARSELWCSTTGESKQHKSCIFSEVANIFFWQLDNQLAFRSHSGGKDREFAYIHEHNWNEQMWNIAGMVDFQSLMEESKKRAEIQPWYQWALKMFLALSGGMVFWSMFWTIFLHVLIIRMI